MAPCCSRCRSRSERAGEQRASTGRHAPGRPLCGPRRCAKRPCPSASCRGPCSQTRGVRAVKRVWAHSVRAEHVLASRETRLRGAPRSRAPPVGARPACPVARPPQRGASLGACPHRGCGTRQAGEPGPRAVTWRLARSGPQPGASPRLLMAVASPGEASGVPFLMHVARASSWEVLVVRPEGVLTGLGPGRGGRPGRQRPLVAPLQEAGSGARWGTRGSRGLTLCPLPFAVVQA